jgi:hypothetical protein
MQEQELSMRSPATPAEEAAEEHDWEMFLRAFYTDDDPNARDEFCRAHNLNRHQRRKLETETRKLRNKRVA